MAEDSPFDTRRPFERRRLLRIAGATAATGALGLGMSKASALAAPGTEGPDDVLDVIIIGGGLSGLTAARDLRAGGCESFLLLEARSRVGGRTLNFDAGGGHVSDVGGQWMGPGQTAVADIARQLNIETFPSFYKGKTAVLGGGGRVDIDLEGTFGTDLTVGAKLGKLSRDVPSGAPWRSSRAAEFDRLSVGDWLAGQNIKPEDQMSWQNSISLSGGAAPAKMGLLHFLSMINSANCDYEQLDSIKHSAQETRFVGGAQALSIALARQLQDKVRMESPVRRITGWDGNIVSIHTDGGEYRARRVIMALSPPLCNQIEFTPALPDGRAALQKAWPAHSPARKSAMVYSRPFWRDQGMNGHIFQYGGPIVWAYDNSPRGGEIGIINAFLINGMVPSDKKAAQQMQARIYAEAWGDEALKPVAYHDADWGMDDPWTITCVSAIPPGFWSKHGEHLKPPCGNLIWSGTETADIWAGYMDGAVRSGHHSALFVLNSLRQA